jgi:hypothetical protein
MQTFLLSMGEVCKGAKKSPPYVRALADSGAIDSYYVPATGWRAFPHSAIDQIKRHERRKAAAGTQQG